MARNDVNKMFEEAKKLIAEHNLFFIEDIVTLLPISKTTFYDYFKVDSNDLDELRDLLNKNRVSVKVQMRKNWQDAESATLQMGLYKLIANDLERQHLSQTHVDVKTGGDKIHKSIPLVLPDGKTYDDLKNELEPE